jgi:chemotaxis protein CheX
MATNGVPVPFLDALTEATIVAFREVAGTEVFRQSTPPITMPVPFDARSSGIALTFSTGKGLLALSVAEAIATALAERVLVGQDVVLDSNLINDCLGEIMNVIAGQGKALLSGTDEHYTFGPPYVADGHPKNDSTFGQVVLTFQSDLGPIALHIWALKSKG